MGDGATRVLCFGELSVSLASEFHTVLQFEHDDVRIAANS